LALALALALFVALPMGPPPAIPKPILAAGVCSPPFSISRFGYCAASGCCAIADVAVAEIVDIRAAAMNVLSPVIVILHFFCPAQKVAPATAALQGVPSDFLPADDVGIAVEKAR
jgi:hypothetical protein